MINLRNTKPRQGADKMKVTPIGSNMTQIDTEKYEILFSYQTPVAFVKTVWNEDIQKKYFKTNKRWSVTTTKHINKWLNGNKAQIIDQTILDSLLEDK